MNFVKDTLVAYTDIEGYIKALIELLCIKLMYWDINIVWKASFVATIKMISFFFNLESIYGRILCADVFWAYIQAGTWRLYNVASTSMQRHKFHRRWCDVLSHFAWWQILIDCVGV